MNPVHSIACGLPFCQNSEGKQTNLSKALRVMAIALGTILALGGVALLLSVPGTVGSVIGWTTLSVGALIALVGACIKCVTKQSSDAIEEAQLEIQEEAIPTEVPEQLSTWLNQQASSQKLYQEPAIHR